MLDLNHLVANPKADVQWFVGDNTVFKVWTKPRGCSMVYILALGAGGNGGNGAVGAAGSSAGGGGGGSGAQSTVCVPAFLIPDLLYIRLGVNGSTGTMVQITPDTTASNGLLFAGSGGNGGNGSGSTGGNAGTGGGVAATTNCPLVGLGKYQFLAGQAGAAGGNAGQGSSVTVPTTGLIVTGGTGGGSTSALPAAWGGGFITGAGFIPSTFTVINATGPNGYALSPPNNPMFFLGALGGSGAIGGANGYTGGAAAYGCGGGGGGGCVTGGTAGTGSPGGSGLVIIIAW